MFCTRARADDAKIVRSRNAQCNFGNHLNPKRNPSTCKEVFEGVVDVMKGGYSLFGPTS